MTVFRVTYGDYCDGRPILVGYFTGSQVDVINWAKLNVDEWARERVTATILPIKHVTAKAVYDLLSARERLANAQREVAEAEAKMRSETSND